MFYRGKKQAEEGHEEEENTEVKVCIEHLGRRGKGGYQVRAEDFHS